MNSLLFSGYQKVLLVSRNSQHANNLLQPFFFHLMGDVNFDSVPSSEQKKFSVVFHATKLSPASISYLFPRKIGLVLKKMDSMFVRTWFLLWSPWATSRHRGFLLLSRTEFLKEMRAKRWSAAMDIFWRKETETEGGSGRRRKRGGNSDNARFHISLEKMNEPSPVSSLAHCCWRSRHSRLLATLFNLKMGTVTARGLDEFHII